LTIEKGKLLGTMMLLIGIPLFIIPNFLENRYDISDIFIKIAIVTIGIIVLFLIEKKNDRNKGVS
jgi:cytochrome c biogenesis protein CcdA